MALLPALLLVGGLVAASDPQPDDTLGTHEVQPGETLWDITEQYLGDEALWRENWRLNPDIADPNKLRVGQKLTVIVERRIPASRAEIRALSNAVEKNRQRTTWTPAAPGDQLEPLDGVRTLRASSAELRINDRANLHMTEYSQVFLQSRETTLREVDRGTIEVIDGSAELEFRPMSRAKTDIELISGSASTRPQPAADGSARLRTTVAEDGGARVMVYSGFGDVSAGGATVSVGSGLGSVVGESGPPGEPERLLGSPRGLLPDGQGWPVSNVPLTWNPLPEAGSYIVDVCGDADCLALVARATDLTEPTWEAKLDAAGEYHWRVTAVSESGLEGYPSRTARFRVESARRDLRGPAVAVVPEGFHRVSESGDLLVGPATRLGLVAADDAVAVARVEYRWDGGPWQPWSDQPLHLPEGPARLEVRATDALGKTGPVAAVTIRD